jgi:hypothetical protein
MMRASLAPVFRTSGSASDYEPRFRPATRPDHLGLMCRPDLREADPASPPRRNRCAWHTNLRKDGINGRYLTV